MVNTEWRGNLTYLEEEKESFPFVLRITKVQKKFIEGLIHWVSLDAVTKWLGKTQEKSNKFIFREYEAVSGAENVEVPANYACELVGDSIKGHLLSSGKKNSKKIATLELKFAGLDTPHDGFLELFVSQNSRNCGNPQKKRKFDLFTNNSTEGPSYQDRISHFKKLTENSAYWYQRVRPRDAEKEMGKNTEMEIEKERKTPEKTLPCPNCGNPMTDKITLSGEKIVACPNYPHCFARYDSDDEFC